MNPTRPALTPARAAALALAFAACAAGAQQVYRIVGPDGKVTFSDQPPPAGTKAVPAPSVPVTGAAAAGGNLPFELRQVTQRYPVTLYSGNACEPCNTGRTLLRQRGIPYTEKTVTTAEDAQALERLAGAATLPVLTIGSQQLKGFSDSEWGQFLDAAGYPKTSQLPAGYRPAAPTPLVVAAPAIAPAAPAASRAAAQPPGPPPAALPQGSNPAGITF